MKQKMPPFRRKKSGKSFPVKVCTLDAELEFNLEVSDSYYVNHSFVSYDMLTAPVHTFVFVMFISFFHLYSGGQQEGIFSSWYAEL